MSLTPEDVENVVFARARSRRQSYDESEVDAFLDLVVRAMRGRANLSADDVRTVSFRKPPLGKRGYAESEVDAFLDLVEAEFSGPR